MAKFDLREYARRGAEARVRELTEELESIYSAFPDLRGSKAEAIRGRKAANPTANEAARGSRKRRMSAAQRKAVGERMRRYWAERRKTTVKAAKK